jgi:hypothetical protein
MTTRLIFTNLSLYQFSGNYLQTLDFLTDSEADVPAQVLTDTMKALDGKLQDKAVNVAKFIRNMETTAEAEMAKRRKILEDRVAWLKKRQSSLKLTTLISSC